MNWECYHSASLCIHVLIQIPSICIFLKNFFLPLMEFGLDAQFYQMVSKGSMIFVLQDSLTHLQSAIRGKKNWMRQERCVGEMGDKPSIASSTSLRFCDNRNKTKCSPRWADNMSPTQRAFSSSTMFPKQQFAPFRHNLERHRMNASFFKNVT